MDEEYLDKHNFIKMLSKALAEHVDNISHVDYELYESTKNPKWKTEFVVVHYKGGATQPRNVSGNSNAANYEEIGKMLYSSQVFGDRDYYSRIIEVSKKIDFE